MELFSNKLEINTLNAIEIIEGAEDEFEYEDIVKAYAYIRSQGLDNSLQGFYKRNINNLIDNNIIDREGNILIDFDDIEE